MSDDRNQPAGSLRTGRLQSISSAMQATLAAMPTRPQPLPTTGTPRTAARPSSGTGMQRSGRGVAVRPNGDQVPEVIRAFGLPMETAGTLGPLLAPLLSWGETSLFANEQFDGTSITGVVVRPGAPRQAVEKALAHVESTCRPCHADLAAQELAHLRVLTVHRARDPKEMQLVAVAYTQRLAEYPVDVVIAACKAWADREEFWPSWAELKAEADKRMRGRLQVRDALRRVVA